MNLKDGATKITIKVGVYLFREDNVFIAYCPALDMSGYGENENEAKNPLNRVWVFMWNIAYERIRL